MLFSGIIALLLGFYTLAAPRVEKYPPSFAQGSHISPDFTLYKGDTSRAHPQTAIVRHEKNGDVVLSVPPGYQGRYKVRFFDETKALLFEIREIQDAFLVVEKYNFGHAGLYQYELYLDNSLVEQHSFRINP